MALTGNTVQSTYLDLVQLEKSGAGLPSHAGKEAALYDGSGAPIVGRTAVRHWLDPDPDAISGSFEFSTMGDMTQGELESAGWTFTECTASVTGGQLVIVKTGAYNTFAKAEITVSLTGDFAYVVGIHDNIMDTISQTGDNTGWGIYAADSSGSANGLCLGATSSATSNLRGYKGSTYANLGSGSIWGPIGVNNTVTYLSLGRNSGTVFFGGGFALSKLLTGAGAPGTTGGWYGTTTADASTFNKLILTGSEVGKEYPNGKRAYSFIRRYA